MTTPSTDFLARAERTGGETLVVLIELTATYPTSHTWYLAGQSYDAEALYSGSPEIQGLLLTVPELLGDGGVGGDVQASPTLTVQIADHLGSYGGPGREGRRFSDWFATPVDGYADPYDLGSATIRCYLVWAVGGTVLPPDTDRLAVGSYTVQPETIRRGPGWIEVTGGPNPKFSVALPRRKLTQADWPNLSADLFGATIPLAFGTGLIVRALPVDIPAGQYLVAESPTATPLRSIRDVSLLTTNPVTQQPQLLPISSTAGVVWKMDSTNGGSTGQFDLTEHAQGRRLRANAFISSVAFYLRLKPTDPDAVGEVTVRLVTDADGFPSDDLIDVNASASMDAGSISAAGWYTFSFPTAVYNRQRMVWAVIRYAKAPTGGTLQIYYQASATTDGFGLAMERGTTNNEWIRAVKITPRIAANDAHLTLQGDCEDGPSLRSYITFGGVKLHRVGPDLPCGRYAQWRGLARFLISDLGAQQALVKLTGRVTERGPAASSSLIAEWVADWGTLGAEDYNGALKGTIGVACTTGDTIPKDIDLDVTKLYQAAKVEGLTHFAVRWRTATEVGTDAEEHGWYGVTAIAQGDGTEPTLELTSAAGNDLWLKITGVGYTTNVAYTDPSGFKVGLITFSRTLGESAIISALVDGMKDDGSGTYTGTASLGITNFADAARWLIAAPQGAALSSGAGEYNATSLTTARTALRPNVRWPPIHLLMDSERILLDWLGRLGRSAKMMHYVDFDGALTCWVEQRTTAGPVRRVRPWEYAELEAMPSDQLSGATGGLPWTRVEAYYAPDRLGLTQINGPPRVTRRRGMPPAPGWFGYAVISAEQTHPPDAARSARAVALTARYGIRSNSGTVGFQTGPTDATSYECLGLTRPMDAGRVMVDYLFDRGSLASDSWGWVTLSLPRFALGWRLFDEVQVESYEFPWRGARTLLSRPSVFFASGATLATPHSWPAGIQFYRARRGIYSVRSLRLNPNGGAQWPVRATLRLIGWET